METKGNTLDHNTIMDANQDIINAVNITNMGIDAAQSDQEIIGHEEITQGH